MLLILFASLKTIFEKDECYRYKRCLCTIVFSLIIHFFLSRSSISGLGKINENIFCFIENLQNSRQHKFSRRAQNGYQKKISWLYYMSNGNLKINIHIQILFTGRGCKSSSRIRVFTFLPTNYGMSSSPYLIAKLLYLNKANVSNLQQWQLGGLWATS